MRQPPLTHRTTFTKLIAVQSRPNPDTMLLFVRPSGGTQPPQLSTSFATSTQSNPPRPL